MKNRCPGNSCASLATNRATDGVALPTVLPASVHLLQPQATPSSLDIITNCDELANPSPNLRKMYSFTRLYNVSDEKQYCPSYCLPSTVAYTEASAFLPTTRYKLCPHIPQSRPTLFSPFNSDCFQLMFSGKYASRYPKAKILDEFAEAANPSTFSSTLFALNELFTSVSPLSPTDVEALPQPAEIKSDSTVAAQALEVDV